MSKALIWFVILSLAGISDVRNEVLNEVEPVAESGPSAEQERIINGFKASQGQFPYLAAIYFRDEFLCTASILSERTILTAAHCVVSNGGVLQNASDYYATIGSTRRSTGTRVYMDSITAHPGYPKNDDDIAFFTTSSRIAFNKLVSPICIAKIHKFIDYYKTGTAIGWGKTNTAVNATPPEDLYYADLRVYSQVECRMLYRDINNFNDCNMCAQLLDKGICHGDSGGPLVNRGWLFKESVQFAITSAVSTKYGCGSSLGPSLFKRLTCYADWLLSESNDKNICVR